MGTRINYEIMAAGQTPAVVLFSTSHHDTEDPAMCFLAEVHDKFLFPTDLVRELLSRQYQTPSGAHRAGDSMFVVDLYPYDREIVLKAHLGEDEPVVFYSKPSWEREGLPELRDAMASKAALEELGYEVSPHPMIGTPDCKFSAAFGLGVPEIDGEVRLTGFGFLFEKEEYAWAAAMDHSASLEMACRDDARGPRKP